MILKQFYLGCLAHASYIVIDEQTKTAAVVDPQRDIEQYLDEAAQYGAAIKYVFLTHYHADFVAGHLELRDRVGASIHVGSRVPPEYEASLLRDGDSIEFGTVRLSILETPGHTPEGVSILVYDLAKDEEVPHAVFTGDTLFVGDVGRPDLLASFGVTDDELAGWLYESLHEKLMTLPDDVLVYPAHGAGSMCGKNLSKETYSTIGAQRKFNYALQPMSKEEFIKVVTADQPKAPAYFGYDAVLNRKERATLAESLSESMKALVLDDVIRLQNSGTKVVDVRNSEAFAAGHLANSVNIALDGRFATWAGTILDVEEPVIILADSGGEYEAAMRLGRIGIDRVVGYLEGGIDALEGRADLKGTVERVECQILASSLQEDDGPLLLDIRTSNEWNDGHVEGAIHIPLTELESRIGELPRNREIALMCRSGYRSSIAASLLKRNAIHQMKDVVGGFEAWKEAALPIMQTS